MKVHFRLATIGVYGFDEESFFKTLTNAGVDSFCDIRQRRALRGSTYAFANSRRLQDRLKALSIKYVHIKELAPSQEVRHVQKSEDASIGITKRGRTELSPAFVQAYRKGCLADFDVNDFVKAVGPNSRLVALFCVEREPEACHRSIVADWLIHACGVHVEHLKP